MGPLSPVSPFSSLIPLAFVIVVSMIKQAYEDFQRHRSDKKVNNSPIKVYEDGKWKDKTWIKIKVGDIVRVEKNCEIPCDLLVLSSSSDNNTCQITTMNLDGETNLKTKSAIPELEDFIEPEDIKNLDFKIDLGPPNPNLYRFEGSITFNNLQNRGKSLDSSNSLLDFDANVNSKQFKTRSVDLSNFVPRGSKLKNTQFFNGIALYTGDDTKMVLNLRNKRDKVSFVERRLNFVLIGLILLLLVSSLVLYILRITTGWHSDLWYVSKFFVKKDFRDFFTSYMSFLSVINYIIPISLYVTLELSKTINILYIGWDKLLYDEVNDNRAVPNTSDIIEELGQIQYIFSDKTGTLTENIMIFKKCFIGDTIFYENKGKMCVKVLPSSDNCDQKKKVAIEPNNCYYNFWTAICLCHTAEVDLSSTENIQYLAVSSDEVALLDAASKSQIKLEDTCANIFTVSYKNEKKYFKIHTVLEFDSNRKRMSVIVEEAILKKEPEEGQKPDFKFFRENLSYTGNYFVFIKGAESHVLDICTSGPIEETKNQITQFSTEGFRTLAVGYKKIDQQQFESYVEMVDKAKQSLDDKDGQLAIAYEKIETDFELLGATSVEDKLQFGVADTLKSLREAGIKIWVLTGDKQETAVNISLNCSHITRNMDIYYINTHTESSENTIVEILDDYQSKMDKNSNVETALVIDGHTLELVLQNHSEAFIKLATRSTVVLCCRMSPLQKAKIVRLVKNSKAKPITLAIGDGANDCGMIQEAHVGVGIIGTEGKQAAMVSDFQLGRFHFLSRLLLVHGYLFYTRLSYTVIYFFYKNFAFCTPVVMLCINSGISPVTTYDDIMLTAYNLIYTSLPVLIYSFIEQRTRITELEISPHLYKELTNNSSMTAKIFLLNIAYGIYQGLLLYLIVYLCHGFGSITGSRQLYSVLEYQMIFNHLIVFCTISKVAFETRYWNWYVIGGYILSVAAFLILYLPLSFLYTMSPSSFYDWFDYSYVLINCYSMPQFWLSLLLTIPLASLPSFIYCSITDSTKRKIRHQMKTNINRNSTELLSLSFV